MGGSPNAARCSSVTIQGLLHLLASMRQGLQVHAGTNPFLLWLLRLMQQSTPCTSRPQMTRTSVMLACMSGQAALLSARSMGLLLESMICNGKQAFHSDGVMSRPYKSAAGVAGVIPGDKAGESRRRPAEDEGGSVSGASLGSDALSLPWYTGQSSLDMAMCCNLTCMALAVLHRMKRYHTVVQVRYSMFKTCCTCHELWEPPCVMSSVCDR